MVNTRYEVRRLTEKAAIWIAWHLPREIVKWCYIRVAVAGENGNPGEQRVAGPLERWG